PLHRGRVFNLRADRQAVVGGRRLSVPSSSGKGLQLDPLLSVRWGQIILSVPSSSGKGLQLSRETSVTVSLSQYFQSPLHRGRVFNEGFRAKRGRPRLPFSPLFIGEGSSTPCQTLS